MGVFDVFSNGKKKHEKAYGRGDEDARNAGVYESALHGLEDVFPGKGSTEYQSYEAGYHKARKRRSRKASSSSYAGSYPTAESPREILIKLGWALLILSIVVGIVYLAKPTPKGRGYFIGASRHINANQLNLRSGPGTDYQKIRAFTRGEEVLEFGQEKERDGHVWIQVSTPDGLTEGWIVRKYLSP